MLTTILVTAIILLFAGVIYLNSKSNSILKSIEDIDDYQKDLFNLIKDNEAFMNRGVSINYALHGVEVFKNFEKQNLVKKGDKVFMVETDWRGVSKLIPTKEVPQQKLPTEETRHTMFEGKRYEYKVVSNGEKSANVLCASPNSTPARK